MDICDATRQVNTYISDYIRFADAKAGLVLTYVSAVGAVTGTYTPEILAAAALVGKPLFAIGLIASGVTAASVVVVVWFALSAISPRLDRGEPSLVSFPDIAGLSPGEYTKQLTALDTREMAAEYGKHNVTLAQLAVKKYRHLSVAIRWANVSLLSSYAAVLIYAISVATRQGHE